MVIFDGSFQNIAAFKRLSAYESVNPADANFAEDLPGCRLDYAMNACKYSDFA
jgi:hypothetical protein